MEAQWITIIAGIIGFVINTVIIAVTFTWKLARVADDLRGGALRHRDELKSEIATERRLVGETLTAMRQKINDVELDTSKTFVRRDSWHQAMNQMQERWAASEKAAEERDRRLEDKIDKIYERLRPSPRSP